MTATVSVPGGLPGQNTAARPVSTAVHHGDHSGLLDRSPPPVAAAAVDAIIVPTARPEAYQAEAIRLARELRCHLVLLCSKQADAGRARQRAHAAGARQVLAVDITQPPEFPEFATTALLANTRFARPTDTSLKRNIGLAMARMAGWPHPVFLDDDITVERADDLRDAVALLSSYESVGLRNEGFPDNSVVCHAYRAVGGIQGSFIGGGALAVAPRVSGFFPNIYNEDWFFLLNKVRLRSTAVAGKAIQRTFDPFRDPRRARAEELGDTLAEGIYWLLDDGRRPLDADVAYWTGFLKQRRIFLDRVLVKACQRARQAPSPELDRMIAAVRGARGRQAHITAELCSRYVQAWLADLSLWQRYLARLPHGISPVEAVRQLGLNVIQGR